MDVVQLLFSATVVVFVVPNVFSIVKSDSSTLFALETIADELKAPPNSPPR